MSGGDWALTEANRIRTEMLREQEPGWSETLDETARYLEGLGKSPLDYVEAWLAFRPSLEAYRRSLSTPTTTRSAPRLRPREPDRVFADDVGALGGRWFVG